MVKEFDKLVKKQRDLEKDIIVLKAKLADKKRKLGAVKANIENIKRYILGE